MKWILFLLCTYSFNAFATQQYSVAECILLEHQVKDYLNSKGENSAFYLQSLQNFVTHCKNPIAKQNNSKKLIAVPTKPINQTTAFNTHQSSKTTQTIQKQQPANSAQLVPISVFKQLYPSLLLLFTTLFILAFIKRKLPNIKGWLGEQQVKITLERTLNKDEFKLMHDVLLLLPDGGSTQIDHIAISRFGIFVIETKNMSGWIFGNEKQAKWTQVLHRAKFYFQNPLRQNYKHTKTLAGLLDLPHYIFHSVVIFTSSAELKTKMPNNVGYINEMLKYIKSVDREIIDEQTCVTLHKLIKEISLNRNIQTSKSHITYLKQQHKNN